MKKNIKRVISYLSTVEVAILPGQIAFFLTLSIIPMVALLGVFASFISIDFIEITNFMQANFPADISEYLEILLDRRGENFLWFFFITFVIASNGPHSIIIAANTMFGKEKNTSSLARRIKALFLMIMLLFLFLFIFIVPTFGDGIFLLYENSSFYFQNIGRIIDFIYLLLKWPLTFFFIFFTIKVIYTIAPDKKIASKDITPGALITTFLWMFGTMLYSLYINNIAMYDLFYGGLSSIVILMFWIYFLSFALVLGMTINFNYLSRLNKLKLEKDAIIKEI